MSFISCAREVLIQYIVHQKEQIFFTGSLFHAHRPRVINKSKSDTTTGNSTKCKILKFCLLLQIHNTLIILNTLLVPTEQPGDWNVSVSGSSGPSALYLLPEKAKENCAYVYVHIHLGPFRQVSPYCCNWSTHSGLHCQKFWWISGPDPFPTLQSYAVLSWAVIMSVCSAAWKEKLHLEVCEHCSCMASLPFPSSEELKELIALKLCACIKFGIVPYYLKHGRMFPQQAKTFILILHQETLVLESCNLSLGQRPHHLPKAMKIWNQMPNWIGNVFLLPGYKITVYTAVFESVLDVGALVLNLKTSLGGSLHW